MEAWQVSVEHRLDSLDRRVGAIEGDVGKIKVDLATLTERVSHLPSKDFIVKTVLGAAAIVSALSLLAPKLQGLFGISG